MYIPDYQIVNILFNIILTKIKSYEQEICLTQENSLNIEHV